LVLASGCAALVFQIAWMRELRLVFGATTAAAAAVLAIFMAGLGIGSAVLGKLADRVGNPLRMYGILEVAIALSAAVTPWLIGLASSVYLNLGGQEALGVAGATAIRLLLAASVMAVPTVLMGGTLPAAVRSVTRATDVHRRALGVLYGSNTLGAVLGSTIATFFALEQLGTRATLMAGCALGFLVGVTAVAMSRSFPPLTAEGRRTSGEPAAATAAMPKPLDGEAEQPAGERLIYLTAAVLGFTFFALELVWYRMLGPILGGTAFTFGLILCVALTGIGVGGIAYNVVFSRLKPSWAALAATCGLEALLTIIPFALGDRLALFTAYHTQRVESFAELVLTWTYVTSIVVLPVALVAGVQFPLLTALLGTASRNVSKHLGMTYAWNTLGAIAGSLVAGFGAMPLLTAPGMWQVIAVALAVLSIVLLVKTRQVDLESTGRAPVSTVRASDSQGRTTRQRLTPANLVVAGLALVTVGLTFVEGPTAVWRHSGIGAGRAFVPDSNPNYLRQWINEKRRGLVWEAEGIESSIGILGQDGLAFVVNGKTDGNSLEDSPTQIGAAILGAVLHEDPKTALVVGLGTGESAGWLARMRNIKHVDVVELEPAIDEMALRCRELNWDVLNNERVRRINNDGREFILTNKDNKYDVIISEPSNPYRAGVASLYTSEFYQAVRERLNPGGIFIQWLQAYEVDSLTVHTVVATARSSFEHVEAWQTLAVDMQLVCSAGPIEYSVAELRERINTEVVQMAMTRAWKMGDLEGFLAHFVASARWADGVAQIPLLERNTDDRTVLEYSFAKTVGSTTGFSIERLRGELKQANYHRPPVAGDAVDWNIVEIRRQEFNLLFTGQMSVALLPRPEDRVLIEALSKFRLEDYAGAIDQWPAEHRPPSDFIQRLALARSYAELGRPECLEVVAPAEEAHPTDAAVVKAIYYWRAKDVAEAANSIEKFYVLLEKSPWVLPAFSEPAFDLSVEIAKVDRNAAQRFYSLVSRPFASRRYNYMRLLTRVLLAEQLGPEKMVEALAELEPDVTWTAEVLELRAKAYAAVNHPYARRAQREWEWYQRHRVPEADAKSDED
jgi:spermidine synthase/MFS family permease